MEALIIKCFTVIIEVINSHFKAIVRIIIIIIIMTTINKLIIRMEFNFPSSIIEDFIIINKKNFIN